MKKFFKSLAVVLALALVITSVPATAASAASVSLKSKTVTLYSEPSTGKTEDGKVCKSYDFWKIAKLLNNFDAETMDIKLVSEDTDLVQKSNKKDMIWVADGASFGTTKVKVIVTSLSTEKVLLEKSITVKVKKNATEDTFKCDLENGSEFEVGETVAVTLSRKNTDTDARKLTCADDSVEIVDANGYGTKYNVTFTKAGKFTLVASAYQSAKYPAPTVEKEIEVVVTSDFAAELTSVKEITVFGSFTKDTKFAITKSKTTVPFTADVAEDGASAVLKLSGKITAGTYVVTDGVNTVELVAENQKPVEIIILEDNDFVTTDGDKVIYIHYDVKDQYDESVRNNFSIQWTISPSKSYRDNRAEGILEVTMDPAPRYNDAVHVTGVYASSGAVATKNAMVYVGLPRQVDTVKVLGVSEVGTGKLADALPAGFVSGEYVLVYEIYDQNGYKLPYENYAEDDKDGKLLSFTSLSALLVGSKFDYVSNVVIDGELYGARAITRGINSPVAGDVALIRISSTKTGTQYDYNLELAEEAVLDVFTILAPEKDIAANDGTVEIPYEAYDQNGNKVTDFRVLCGNVTLGSGLWLDKQKDGSAKLKYDIPDTVNATETTDYPVVLISTVPKSGNVSNTTIYIKANAYSAAVTGLQDVGNYLVEGTTVEISSMYEWGKSLTYVDQYDRGSWKRYKTNDIVAVVKKSNATAFAVTSDAIQGVLGTAQEEYITFNNDQKLEVTAKDALGSTQAQTFTFALYDKKEKEIVGGSEKKVTLTAVNINKVTDFSIDVDTNIYFTESNNEIKVNGKYAGEKVSIPKEYWVNVNDVAGGIVVTSGAAVDGTGAKVMLTETGYTTDAQFINDQYNTLPDGSKNYITRTINVKVSVRNMLEATTSAVVRDVVYANITVGGSPRAASKIALENGDNVSVQATKGELILGKLSNIDDDAYCDYKVIDQYDDEISTNITLTISQLTEGANGIHSKNTTRNELTTTLGSAVVDKDGTAVMLENIEIGDTFVLLLEVDGVKATVKVTVIDDREAIYPNAKDSDVTWR